MAAKKSSKRKRSPAQRGKAHPDTVKAQVIAALLLGGGVMEIASELGLPHSTVSTYKAQIPDDKLDEFRRKKGERLDEMVYEYAVATLTALAAQARTASDPGYLRRQPAGSLAILHGVMSDKIVRLLEAAERASKRDNKNLLGGDSGTA